MWKVVGTPGPFAMGSVAKEISAENVYYKMGEKEGK
ncbi:hypothetical protein DES38_11539 [Streptohalobacillus salinus]|uniref:Uncharacterized protein n=1 Tax=Streptohalobacillus salinus TaxID=621096 RepID=A0A2V3W1C3_9BACI|nr:hypothetical protein DES38_11539 [Streptohalobacillus salinus]